MSASKAPPPQPAPTSPAAATAASQGASTPPPASELATLGGGCFWCTEAVFTELRGVTQVLPGYSGGSLRNPTYEQVCEGDTGHAEVVQITFDPRVLSYHDLLMVFLSVHDPTTLNRQGNDTGTQYRSVIFYHSPEQKADAEGAIREITAQSLWRGRLVTEVAPFAAFYPAEEYHRNYFQRNPDKGYCQLIIAPKVAKFRQHFLGQLKTT
ncbi:MAG: peptide-methionine (S)-S-oxide reductase MsrA [Thermoplasmata archaeon]|nr:peptide-methionine (S)-S-oxide reductase MsrA [Thermoplasmata archaeon]